MSRKHFRILWSNRLGEELPGGYVPCFPIDESRGTRLEADDVRFLMTELSTVYTELLDRLVSRLGVFRGDDPEAARVVLRESVVLITYALADRIWRLRRVLADQPLAEFAVARVGEIALPDSNARLIGMVDGSQHFNQHLLGALAAAIWQLPVVSVEREVLADARNATSISNHNFDHPSLVVRVRRKIKREVAQRFGRFPALRLANIEAPLLDHGLYGPAMFRWMNELGPAPASVRDPALRARLLDGLAAELEALLGERLFAPLGIVDRAMRTRAAATFCDLLVALIPPERLEGIPHYLGCEQRLRSLAPPALFFCAMPSVEEIYWIAAARKLRIPVIGVQHGAHYGFTSQACFIDTEFAYCDAFITWGWADFPFHPLCTGMRAISLPSPWLSERARFWRQIPALATGGREARPHDVLLMSDRIQVFPPTVSTLRMSRLDFLGCLNAATYTLVSELARRDIRVLNKPFNYTSRDMQADVLNRLAGEFPDQYREHPKLDKGLTAELLHSAWLVLWDEPGTGFFECLAGGIPTMVYWERLTSHEESYARADFERLEEVGLLHDSPTSLVAAVARFLDDPEAWQGDARRREVVDGLMNRYALTNDRWSSAWKRALNNLAIETRPA